MIRTHVIPCHLARAIADALNLASGEVYTGVLVVHWRVLRRKDHWLSQYGAMRWSDARTTVKMHAHSIDAAQEGFYKACDTTRGLRRAGFTEAKFPHWRKKFRTTIWKISGIRRKGDTLVLSTGGSKPKVEIAVTIPVALRDVLRFLEVRLVYDRKSRCYRWHLVVENGIAAKPSPGPGVVAVDLGETPPSRCRRRHQGRRSSPWCQRDVRRVRGTRSGWPRSRERSARRSRVRIAGVI